MVGHDQHCLARVRHVPQHLEKLVREAGVHSVGRLVEENEAGVLEKGDEQPHPLELSTRKLVERLVERALQAHLGQELADVGLDSQMPAVDLEELADGRGKMAVATHGVLRDVGDARVVAVRHGTLAQDEKLPRVRRELAQEQPHERRLARSVPAHQGDQLARAQAQVQAGYDGDALVRELEPSRAHQLTHQTTPPGRRGCAS